MRRLARFAAIVSLLMVLAPSAALAQSVTIDLGQGGGFSARL
ncbi:MAG TPA: flagellar biosynthetic protein FliP, partial [Parvularcula sp.]|nr:flagellar biosynthetic protein FliP [Parvularcula sp.]HBS33030.1 flagellar biosynthetic protein FliP [Parvularcula sp.]